LEDRNGICTRIFGIDPTIPDAVWVQTRYEGKFPSSVKAQSTESPTPNVAVISCPSPDAKFFDGTHHKNEEEST
jgi:hypothetical protein